MAKINILFDGTDYPVDESALEPASSALKSHLSTTMAGSGATIQFGGTTYSVDSAKLDSAKNTFITHLGTIAGNGSRVVIDGVEYFIDDNKITDAISELEEVLAVLKKVISCGVHDIRKTTNYEASYGTFEEPICLQSDVVMPAGKYILIKIGDTTAKITSLPPSNGASRPQYYEFITLDNGVEVKLHLTQYNSSGKVDRKYYFFHVLPLPTDAINPYLNQRMTVALCEE